MAPCPSSPGLFQSGEGRQHCLDAFEGVSTGRQHTHSLDVYDLAEQKRKPEVAERILDLAVRTKDHVVMADIIRQLSVLKVRDANRLRRLLDLAKQLPEDRERKAVELFVKWSLPPMRPPTPQKRRE